jgi:triosephosphate isomerase (TIM)
VVNEAPSGSQRAAKRRSLVVGNWKMNGSAASNEALLAALKAAPLGDAEVSVCVPAVYLHDVADSLHGGAVHWGAQDCSSHESGAYTGEISAAMLAEFGCCHVIVGHSERRALHGEDDALVHRKVQAAQRHALTPILCVGEGLDVRQAGGHVQHCRDQLDAALADLTPEQVQRIVIAYEPVWAIGTGEVATPDDAQEVCGALRARLAERFGPETARIVRILYGGSVKAGNTAGIMAGPDIDGALVGGASLDADEFASICRIAADGS